ncbi:MotA/TolQ/ExbB proton channel family protein [Ideonella margarita]|uniref:Biopolymer transport protein ExbB n=1 Tax=Ideonella margarita TaxID=2984191 RepID=A0ABU9C9C1_9BURK
MGGLPEFWSESDAIGRAVALALLAMSVGAWVLILWKGWLLNRARHDITHGTAIFWDAPELAAARERLQAIDREQTLLPLVEAAFAQPTGGTLQAQGDAAAQRTRRLRDALNDVLNRLQSGQVFLASVGAVAPFVGLFGTVWGIYHALLGMASSGSMSIDKIAGPVGEALVMTAAGLAVAIPAVLAYNVFGKRVGQCEAELEGFAHDLHELAGHRAAPSGD